MVETSKQVRVDNWGIFFLSRLQVFFNKTDYCDLTLQFEGNVQLKVHRLVMNACTEYFQILEQTCEVIDDVILMPPDLQADVILPIVNFMYTGMLEFQMSIFDKLYKTAELMNITVLLKLLDAQKQPHQVPKSVVSKVPPTYNLQGKKISPRVDKGLPATLPGRKLPVWKRKTAPSHSVTTNPTSTFVPEVKRSIPTDPLAFYDNAPKPTRFEWPEEDLKNINMLDSFDNISYNSKPLLTQEDELRASTSFDSIRYIPNSNKRSKEYSNSSVDMEELKNYVKEQKIRSDLLEYEDDPDNDLDPNDPDYVPENLTKRKLPSVTSTPTKKVRFNISEKENKERKINITPSGRTDVDHSKIISEVLKKYPHLVKKNKNIRLKILAKNKTSPEATKNVQPLKATSKVKVQLKKSSATPLKLVEAKPQSSTEGSWTCEKCTNDGEPVEFVLYYLYRKHMTDVHNEKFDSRMCKYCGHKSTKHNMLMYHQYTKHGIKPPPAYVFPKCPQCPYVALTEKLMVKHKLTHTKFDLQCRECKIGFNSDSSLKQHIQITGHTGKTGRNNYDCQYCTKHYQTGANLFSHIRLQHRDEARRDGIVSIDEEDEVEDDDESMSSNNIQEIPEKIKILSNVQLPPVEEDDRPQVQTMPSSEAEALNNVASGIATSLGLVDIVVLDENQQYILHSNEQQLVAQPGLANNQQFILPELTEAHTFVQNQGINQVITSEHNVITQSMLGNSDIASTDELVMVLTDHDYNDGNNEILSNDNSNIVVLYSHPVEGQENQFITSQGNLMLNSETGLLEIRNSTINPPEAVVSQTTTVESIEMIQREIESHGNVKLQTITTTSEIPAEVSTTDSTEVVEHASEISQAAELINQEGEEKEFVETADDVGVSTETADDVGVSTETADGVDGLNEETGQCEEKASEDVVEGIPPVIHEEKEEEIKMNDEPEPEPMEVDEEECNNPEKIDVQVLSTIQTEVEEQMQNQTLQIEKLTKEIETPLAEEEVKSAEEEISESSKVEENQDVEETQKPLETIVEEVEKTEIEKQVQEGDLNNENSMEIIDETSEEDPKSVHNLQNEFIPEPMEVDGRMNNQVINSLSDVPPEIEIPEGEPEIIENNKESIEEENLNHGIESPASVQINELNANNEIQPDIVEEEEEEISKNEENASMEEIVTPVDESNPSIDETEDLNKNLEENEPKSIQSTDEESQKSNDTGKEEEKLKATKISILDDWEDTDSQQSEHGKSANTVNKLINDWDDD